MLLCFLDSMRQCSRNGEEYTNGLKKLIDSLGNLDKINHVGIFSSRYQIFAELFLYDFHNKLVNVAVVFISIPTPTNIQFILIYDFDPLPHQNGGKIRNVLNKVSLLWFFCWVQIFSKFSSNSFTGRYIFKKSVTLFPFCHVQIS